MIFLLLLTVFCVLIYVYFVHARYILHPSIVVGLVTLLGVVVASANYSLWGDVEGLTYSVVVAGVMAFMLGGVISSFINRRCSLSINGRRLVDNNMQFKNGIIISKNKTIMVIGFMSIVTIWYLLEMREYAGTNSLFLLNIFTAARTTVYTGKAIVLNSVLQQGIYMCKALTYVYVFYIIYQLKIERKRIKLLYYVPIFLYVVQMILSTSRSEIIYFVYGILIIYYCLHMKQKGWKQKNDYNFFGKIIKAFIIFMLVFVVLGNVRNNVNSSLIEVLSRYIGSPIYALDDYIRENGVNENASFWGEETQYLLYSVFRKLGISDRITDVTLLPTYIGMNGSVRTNIYTPLRRYLHDYGFGGMVFINSILGYAYTSLFEKIRKYDNKYLIILFYAFLSYPLTEMAVEERFFNNLLTARTVMCCIYILISFKMLVKDRVENEVLSSESVKDKGRK